MIVMNDLSPNPSSGFTVTLSAYSTAIFCHRSLSMHRRALSQLQKSAIMHILLAFLMFSFNQETVI